MVRDKQTYVDEVVKLEPTITAAEFDGIWDEFLSATSQPGYDPLVLIQNALSVGFSSATLLDQIQKMVEA